MQGITHNSDETKIERSTYRKGLKFLLDFYGPPLVV